MQENQDNVKGVDDDEVNLLDYLIVLAKHKKLIISITFGLAVITAIISVIMPPVYMAETQILPPKGTSSMAAAMLAQVGGGLSSLAGSALGVTTPGELYVGMIESRTVIDNIIDRFHLMKVYDEEYRVDMRQKMLDDILDAQSDSSSGIVTIDVEDEDPKRAAEMANAFVAELNHLNSGLAITDAAQRRLFFEDQLKDTKVALAKAEDSMKAFMEKTGAIQVDSQAGAVISGIATLKAEIAAKEVELDVLRSYSTPNNSDLQMAETGIRGLKEQLSKLEAKDGGKYDPLISTRSLPEVGLEYARKLRDVKFNETLYGLLMQQYELAKLDEAKESSIVQVVSKAVPPDKRYKPKRTLMVVVGTFLGFFISVFAAFFIEYREKASEDPENRKRFEMLRKYLRIKNKEG